MNDIFQSLIAASPAIAAALSPAVVLGAKKAAETVGARIPDAAKAGLNVIAGVVLATLAGQVTGGHGIVTGDPVTDGVLVSLGAGKVRDLARTGLVGGE